MWRGARRRSVRLHYIRSAGEIARSERKSSRLTAIDGQIARRAFLKWFTQKVRDRWVAVGSKNATLRSIQCALALGPYQAMLGFRYQPTHQDQLLARHT